MTGLLQINVTLATLLKMRELLSDPNNWCQGDLSTKGRVCLVGSIDRAMNVDPFERGPWTKNDEWQEVYRALQEQSGQQFVAHFNDRSTHAEVLGLLDRAIAARVC